MKDLIVYICVCGILIRLFDNYDLDCVMYTVLWAGIGMFVSGWIFDALKDLLGIANRLEPIFLLGGIGLGGLYGYSGYDLVTNINISAFELIG
jgi:hypothetical protein